MKIPLTRGLFALVDAVDYPALCEYHWQAVASRGTFYARRAQAAGTRKQVYILMHRQIMSAPKKILVDHWDRDGLNNTRSNLRLCTNAQNTYNQKLRSSNSSGFRGVCHIKGAKGWAVMIQGDYLGLYEDKEEAARAYDTEALKRFGEFASLNFPDDFRPVLPRKSDLRPDSTSGFTGVVKVIKKGKVRWYARIFQDSRIIHVGTYDSPEMANEARKSRLLEMENRRQQGADPPT